MSSAAAAVARPTMSFHSDPAGHARPTAPSPLDLGDVAARIERRLAAGRWEEDRLLDRVQYPSYATDGVEPPIAPEAAAEVATFALGLSGKRRDARRGGRVSRLVAHFALAAMLALTGLTVGCDESDSDSGPSSALVSTKDLGSLSGVGGAITAPARQEPARFTQLVLLDPGNAATRWALLAPLEGLSGDLQGVAPVLVDREGADLQKAGTVYDVPAQPIPVGSRDGASQFLDPLDAAEANGASFDGDVQAIKDRLLLRWRTDERFGAATRAIAGQPTVLDAAYNAQAAYAAGGAHTYLDGVVLRVDLDHPVLQVADRALLESGKPLRTEDVVYVAIRAGERSLYNPGQVVALRNVAVDRQEAAEGGQTTAVYVANAALDGARVEPTGTVDLQSLLDARLKRTDADLAIQAQELGAAEAGPTPQATPAPATGQTTVVREYRGPSFVDDLLVWWWLSNSGWYRGSSYTVVNPPPSPTRPRGDYYYVPPSTGPSTSQAPAQTTSRSTVLQSARNAVSGQASGTGGGTAATAKAAADSSARVSAATNKAASLAGQVSSSSAGKSVASVSSKSSSPAARSSGSITSSSRSSGSSVTSGSSSVSRGSSGGFGGSGAKGGGAS